MKVYVTKKLCILVYDFHIIFVESLTIKFQSAKEVRVSQFHRPVPLVTVPSHHNGTTVYKWMLMGESPQKMLQFPSSPVIFVLKEGIYHCQVSSESETKVASPMRVVLEAADAIGTCMFCLYM